MDCIQSLATPDSCAAFALPDKPLRNASVAGMTVAENLVFRNFDMPPYSKGGWLLRKREMERAARGLPVF